jgi:hypothetical protein
VRDAERMTVAAGAGMPDPPPYPPPPPPPQETTIPARRADTTGLIRIFRTFIMNISSRSVRGAAGHRGVARGRVGAERIVERKSFATAAEPASRDDRCVNRDSEGLFRFESGGALTFCYK